MRLNEEGEERTELKQVVAIAGKVLVSEVPPPECDDNSLLIRTSFSVISTGTETWTIDSTEPITTGDLIKDSSRLTKAVDLSRKVLREEGLELKQLQIKGLREMFFSKGERDAWMRPARLNWDTADDERHPGKYCCTLQFDLPRGCYATMVVKRITT